MRTLGVLGAAHAVQRGGIGFSAQEKSLKLVLFTTIAATDTTTARPGLLTERGIVDASAVVKGSYTPQLTMEGWIDNFEALRPQLERLLAAAPAIPAEQVKLLPPLPRPGKIVCCIANYWEHAQREPRPLNMFMKNPDAVIGPGDTIRLPEFSEPWAFMHEAELALVIKGPVKSVSRENWRSAIFGYTCLIDVTARGEGRATWKKNSWMGKSFDTFAPLGPCIVTADEIPDPNSLHVQFWNNGELRHNYNTDDMEHRVPEIVEFASTIMTLKTGDVLSCGTNHEGLGFVQDGEQVEIAIHGIGRMQLNVVDPLKRQWERGVYMGADSTNPEAVRRHRPPSV
jgi:2-keto-4-pentenoate hydratase/2-oxohepta-3-ene-1,7-dioic acid hydratase in catechol pathway